MRSVNLLATALVLVLSGCASTPSMVGTPAAGSQFSKLQPGMSHAQVINLIGSSKDCKFITPGFMGVPEVRLGCPYKNEGMLTFNAVSDAVSGVLIQIAVDTAMGDYQPISK